MRHAGPPREPNKTTKYLELATSARLIIKSIILDDLVNNVGWRMKKVTVPDSDQLGGARRGRMGSVNCGAL